MYTSSIKEIGPASIMRRNIKNEESRLIIHGRTLIIGMRTVQCCRTFGISSSFRQPGDIDDIDGIDDNDDNIVNPFELPI